jgi:hypothetical protein
MITARIQSIILEKDRFRVSVQYSNGVEESKLFNSEVTAQDIKDVIVNRLIYWNGLSKKEQEFQKYVNMEIQ